MEVRQTKRMGAAKAVVRGTFTAVHAETQERSHTRLRLKDRDEGDRTEPESVEGRKELRSGRK